MSLPEYDLDFTQLKELDTKVSFTRGSTATGWVDGELIEFAENEPRLIRDPASKQSGLFLEPVEATNLLKISQPTLIPATGANIEVELATRKILDGPLYRKAGRHSEFIVLSGAAGGAIPLSAGKTYCFSMFADFAGTTALMYVSDGSGYLPTTVVGAGGGLYRHYVVYTPANNENTALHVRFTPEGIFGCFQLEEGIYPSSYIPTKGSAVTRLGDRCNILTNKLNYKKDAGTLLVDYINLGSIKETGSYVYGIYESEIGKRTGERFEYGWSDSLSRVTNTVYPYPAADFGQPTIIIDPRVNVRERVITAFAWGDLQLIASARGKVSEPSTIARYPNIKSITLAPLEGKKGITMLVRRLSYYNERLSETKLKILTDINKGKLMHTSQLRAHKEGTQIGECVMFANGKDIIEVEYMTFLKSGVMLKGMQDEYPEAYRQYSIVGDGDEWLSIGNGFGTDSILTVAYGNGLWIMAGESGKLATSKNGFGWAEQDSGFGTSKINSVAYGNGLWVAVGEGGKVAASRDGVVWAMQNGGFGSSTINGVAHGDGLWVAVGDSGKIATSTNGTTWVQRTSSPSYPNVNLNAVAHGDDGWLIVGDELMDIISVDNGATWAAPYDHSADGYSNLYDVTYSNGIWVACGEYGDLVVKSGGIAGFWLNEDALLYRDIYAVVYDGEVWMMVGSVDAPGAPEGIGAISIKENITDRQADVKSGEFGQKSFRSIAVGDGVIVAVGDEGKCFINVEGQFLGLPIEYREGQSTQYMRIK